MRLFDSEEPCALLSTVNIVVLGLLKACECVQSVLVLHASELSRFCWLAGSRLLLCGCCSQHLLQQRAATRRVACVPVLQLILATCVWWPMLTAPVAQSGLAHSGVPAIVNVPAPGSHVALLLLFIVICIVHAHDVLLSACGFVAVLLSFSTDCTSKHAHGRLICSGCYAAVMLLAFSGMPGRQSALAWLADACTAHLPAMLHWGTRPRCLVVLPGLHNSCRCSCAWEHYQGAQHMRCAFLQRWLHHLWVAHFARYALTATAVSRGTIRALGCWFHTGGSYL